MSHSAPSGRAELRQVDPQDYAALHPHWVEQRRSRGLPAATYPFGAMPRSPDPPDTASLDSEHHRVGMGEWERRKLANRWSNNLMTSSSNHLVQAIHCHAVCHWCWVDGGLCHRLR